jgi:hypothetical protein
MVCWLAFTCCNTVTCCAAPPDLSLSGTQFGAERSTAAPRADADTMRMPRDDSISSAFTGMLLDAAPRRLRASSQGPAGRSQSAGSVLAPAAVPVPAAAPSAYTTTPSTAYTASLPRASSTRWPSASYSGRWARGGSCSGRRCDDDRTRSRQRAVIASTRPSVDRALDGAKVCRKW